MARKKNSPKKKEINFWNNCRSLIPAGTSHLSKFLGQQQYFRYTK
jgi:hypothetical protein